MNSTETSFGIFQHIPIFILISHRVFILIYPFLSHSLLYEPDLEGAGQTEGFAVAGHVARRGFLHFVHVTCYFTHITFESQFFVLIHAFAVC